MMSVRNECSCKYPGFSPIKSDLKVCLTPIENQCLLNTYSNVMENESKYCDKFCPYTCDSIKISTVSTSSNYPSDAYVSILLNTSFMQKTYPNISANQLKSNLVSFNLYYSDFKFLEISQSPTMTTNDFISAIGGGVGKQKNNNINLFKIL